MSLPKELTTVTPTSRIVALIMILTLPFVGFFLGITYQTTITKITNSRNQRTSTLQSNNMNDNEWITFKSDRGDFSFQHPRNWPVTQCKSALVFQFENRIEQIDFNNECFPNDGGARLGSVSVERLRSSMTPEEYIKGLNDPKYFNVSIEKKQVGTETGYFVTAEAKNQKGMFTHNLGRYYIFKNRFVYTILLTDKINQTPDKVMTMETFNKILSTFRIE